MADRSQSQRKVSESSKRRREAGQESDAAGREARGGGLQVRTYQIGAAPILNHFLDRLRLDHWLRDHLPPDDPRTELPTARALLVLVRNLLLSREPIYGVGDWSAAFAPDVLDLFEDEWSRLQDDRLGRCLDRLFEGAGREFILAVVRHALGEFDVRLDELHNDSTTVSFFGAYEDASEEGTRRGRPTAAITYGHSKDHRPDLKQLLYTLTVTDDGGVPVYFGTASGNVVDDTTHRDTWDLLRELVGKPDFLYVADCKLSSQENLAHIAQRGGRFVTVLPASRREDGQFRQRLREQPAAIRWTELYQRTDERDEVCDTLSVHSDEETSSDGYRLLWYHSTRKRELDRTARLRRIERAVQELRGLNARLLGPRSRFRQREQVDAAVAAIRNEHDVTTLLRVEIHETPRETYKQAQPGRPTSSTKYVRESRASYDLSMEVDMLAVAAAEAGDGVFPLLTNDRSLSAEQVLRAYKRQPLIEKRFSQFKTDFAVAPVYLKNVARVQGLLAAYFLVLLIQTLLERELRLALARTERGTLPLYPEARPCRRPTTRRVLDAFESVQRHVVTLPDGTEQTLVTELSPLQREILQLLRINPTQYGR